MDFLTPELIEQGIQRPLETIILILGIVLVLVALGGLLFVRMQLQQQRRVLGLAERQQTHLERYDPRLDAMNDNLRSAGELWRALANNIAVLTQSMQVSTADVTARLSLLEGSFTEYTTQEAKALEILPVLRDKTNALQISVDGLPGKLKAEIADALKGILEELKNVKVEMQSAKRPCDMLEQLQGDVRALMARIESATSADDEEDTVQLKPIQENSA